MEQNFSGKHLLTTRAYPDDFDTTAPVLTAQGHQTLPCAARYVGSAVAADEQRLREMQCEDGGWSVEWV
ncbi:hypothetical protein BDW66DRAFT_144507 [Aspergillus desertorum]